MQGVFARPTEIFSLSVIAFFEKIDEVLFTPDFDTYEHLTFLNDPLTFKWLILGVYFGLVIASFVMFYNKNVLGALIRRLDEACALSPESAKTLDELGFSKNIFVKLSLKRGNTLRKLVAIAPAEGEASEDGRDLTLFLASVEGRKYSVDTERFYLPEKKRDVAVDRFRKKGSGWLSVVLMVVVGLLVTIAIMKLAPSVAGLIESLIDGMSGEQLP